MKHSYWLGLILGLILAMGMPTAWGQIPDNIEIKFAPLMDRTEDRFAEEIRSNREHVEISADGFGMKLQEGRRVYYHRNQRYGYESSNIKAVAFDIIVSTNWNNLNLRYYIRPGTAKPDSFDRFRGVSGHWRNTGDYRPFAYGITAGAGNSQGYTPRPEDHSSGTLAYPSGGYPNSPYPPYHFDNWAWWQDPPITSDMPKQSRTHTSILILDDNHPEPDETFTVVFEEASDDPQYRWTFTVTIKDDDPERIPTVELNVRNYVISTNFPHYIVTTNWGPSLLIPEDTRHAFRQSRFGVNIVGIRRWGTLFTDTLPAAGPFGTFMFDTMTNLLSRGSIPIPVDLTVPTGRTAVSVDYATQDGTAIAGQDYTATSGTLTFQPGEKLSFINVPILDDAIYESNEFFKVVLSNPVNAVLWPRSAVDPKRAVKVHILDNDEPATDTPPVNVDDPPPAPPPVIIVSPPIGVSPTPTEEVGQRSSDLRFTSTSLSLAEGESATYQVRATANQARDMVVNIASAHSGITVNPNRLTFYSHNWQTYQTVTVIADADAADTNEQASIQHSIPASNTFVANNNAGIVSVSIAHTVVEEEEETSKPPSERQPIQREYVPPTDYDQDDDGLIDVSNLAQLNAIRWDLNGDGQPDKEEFADDYSQAFPSAIANMGMPADIKGQGYELTANLHFDTTQC